MTPIWRPGWCSCAYFVAFAMASSSWCTAWYFAESRSSTLSAATPRWLKLSSATKFTWFATTQYFTLLA